MVDWGLVLKAVGTGAVSMIAFALYSAASMNGRRTVYFRAWHAFQVGLVAVLVILWLLTVCAIWTPL